jgi:exodeoxyribonuclease V alpha subunit
VFPFNSPSQQEIVIVHQFGRQFKSTKAVERKPATAALEKYLGSGLIKGVGPKIAKKIVTHFGDKALDIFEGDIERLTEFKALPSQRQGGGTVGN